MGLFRSLFFKHKILVAETVGYKNYTEIAQRLYQNGISFETVIERPNTTIGNVMQDAMDETERAFHSIYVKKEDEHSAKKALE
ncbi:hypothetical protein [Planococcus lenghuensis]|uniref:Uncharacterized protein n=1 Tax=Planococcus lenghuensis TaxID=2213202 RepID=A0A1Q2KZ79_9BACL|nr:hypothetical protein [Planococcus lenghuensis]AQQ53107.1 hypothetical protein B0X71_08365 [Planococcus lenghuensis]